MRRAVRVVGNVVTCLVHADIVVLLDNVRVMVTVHDAAAVVPVLLSEARSGRWSSRCR